jgi:hypothetical protein
MGMSAYQDGTVMVAADSGARAFAVAGLSVHFDCEGTSGYAVC